MSGDNKREEQPNVLTVIAAAATVGAIAVGLLGAVSSYFNEQEEPLREGAGGSGGGGSNSRSLTGPRRSSRTISEELEEWVSHNNRPTAEQDNVPQGLQCKICEARQITHVLGCGHTLCRDCAAALIKTSRRCPFDRETMVRAPQKMYM